MQLSTSNALLGTSVVTHLHATFVGEERQCTYPLEAEDKLSHNDVIANQL